MIHAQLAYSVDDAARVLGISSSLCYRLIAEGRLRATLHPGTTKKAILAAELDRYVAEELEDKIAKGA